MVHGCYGHRSHRTLIGGPPADLRNVDSQECNNRDFKNIYEKKV
jgi:hypothetical protein